MGDNKDSDLEHSSTLDTKKIACYRFYVCCCLPELKEFITRNQTLLSLAGPGKGKSEKELEQWFFNQITQILIQGNAYKIVFG